MQAPLYSPPIERYKVEMERLRTHYRVLTRLWAAAIVFLSSFTIEFVAPQMNASIGALIVKYAASTGVLSGLFLAGEFFIRRYSWKSVPLFHRFGYHGHDDINYEGLWYGETLYRVVEQSAPKRPVTVPFSATHDVRISQDCLTVKIDNTSGTNFPSWKSVSATINDDKVLRFLYEVDYADLERFAPHLYGYEWLSPMRHAPRDIGRPIVIHGRFGHVVGDGKPTYSGSTLFIRRGYAASLTVNDLPEAFIGGKLAAQLTAGDLV